MTRLLARLLLASRMVDVLFRKFEAARVELVLALASDRFLERYNDLAYGATSAYHPGSPDYRDELFAWEQDALSRCFPPPPARVLVGAAGGGREAFALARRGYAVEAFEPSDLVQRMAEARPGGSPVGVFRARYADLPLVRRLDGELVRLDSAEPFDAGIVGWGSFSHLVTDEERVSVLRRMADLVAGPVLVSYFGAATVPGTGRATGLRRLRLAWRGDRRPGYSFTIDVGGFRQLTEPEMRGLADRAGVDVEWINPTAVWPHAVVRRRALTTSAGAPDSTIRPASMT